MKVRELHIDAYDCKCNLNDSKLLLPILVRAAKKSKFKVVKKIVYHYKPYGLTIVLLLAETHASLFTWPELGYAAVEIFLCNEKKNPYKFWKIIKKALMPKRVKIKEIVRNITK